MERDLPPAPWLRRLPSGVWTVVTWCAAGLLALLLFASTTYRMVWPFGLQHPAFAPALALRAALAVILALAVGWVRRWPEQVFGVLLAESVAVVLLRERTWPLFLAMGVLVGYLAAVRPRRISVLAGVTELAVWWGEALAVNDDLVEFSDFASSLLGAAASIAIPWAIGNSIRQQRGYSQALRAYAAGQAVTAERLRIARELHDAVAHSIGVIAIQAGAASLVLDVEPAGARRALDAIESTSRETLAGLRRMLVSLRQAETGEAPPALAPLAGLEAVDRLAETMARAGVEVDVRWQGRSRPLPPEVELAAFRIVQESVTNVVRHSGGRRCEVRITYQEEELTIEVLDEGRGPVLGRRTGQTGYGILGMRERVALLNGRFSAGSRPEGGFRVAARLPA
ncbi:sensor histidine kinase [Streptomyces sp. NPDC006739]|uniref:sensor histidine kinase n=1 Tax=Streptomyces sp. NPDC006739 TaxID=3364763 RepID=UPI00369E3152